MLDALVLLDELFVLLPLFVVEQLVTSYSEPAQLVQARTVRVLCYDSVQLKAVVFLEEACSCCLGSV